jgi:hypothetical protein
MSVKTDKVKSGYAELDYLDREEIRKFIEDFEKHPIEKRKSILENLNKTFNKSLGPIFGNNCPCCGKS